MFRHSVRWLAPLVVASVVALGLGLRGATSPDTAPTTPQVSGEPSMLTVAQGQFRFEGLHSASHILRVDPQTLPPGLNPNPAGLAMTLSPGVTIPLAITPKLTLRATYHDDGAVLDGTLFHDHDGDGVQGTGELGLAGVRVIDPDVYQYFVPF